MDSSAPLPPSVSGNYTWVPKPSPPRVTRKSGECAWFDPRARILDGFSQERIPIAILRIILWEG